MSRFPFPSYGYYEELRDKLESCTYAQLKERMGKARLCWNTLGMVEQYASQLFAQQSNTIAKIQEALDAFDGLTYGDIRGLVRNIERK